MTEWHNHLLIYSSDVPTYQTSLTHLTDPTHQTYLINLPLYRAGSAGFFLDRPGRRGTAVVAFRAAAFGARRPACGAATRVARLRLAPVPSSSAVGSLVGIGSLSRKSASTAGRAAITLPGAGSSNASSGGAA